MLGLLGGFAPWIMFAGQPIPIGFPWERWLIYAAPLLGLVAGILGGLAYLVAGHVILLLLDYGATLDGILNGIRHLARVRPPQGAPTQRDVFTGEDSEPSPREKTL